MTAYLPAAPSPSLDSNPLKYWCQDNPVPLAKGKVRAGMNIWRFSQDMKKKKLGGNLPDNVAASSCFTKNPDEACFLHLEKPQPKLVYLNPPRFEKRQLKKGGKCLCYYVFDWRKLLPLVIVIWPQCHTISRFVVTVCKVHSPGIVITGNEYAMYVRAPLSMFLMSLWLNRARLRSYLLQTPGSW